MDFSERIKTGSLANHDDRRLPQLGMIDFIPEKGIACPQCDTVFVANIVRECLFCGYKEGRAIDPDKELRYKMKYSEKGKNCDSLQRNP